MPLNTQIIRNGKPLEINWGGFHVAAMTIAAAVDSGKGPWEKEILDKLGKETGPIPITPRVTFSLTSYMVIAATPLNDGEYKLMRDISFIDTTDGELFELKNGDTLIAVRGW
jgi:hypothetical protein